MLLSYGCALEPLQGVLKQERKELMPIPSPQPWQCLAISCVKASLHSHGWQLLMELHTMT